MQKTNIWYSIAISLFSTVVVLNPMAYADSEHESEHESEEESCMECGVVTTIQATEQAGSSGLVGAATGAIAGGVAGNQLGQTDAAKNTIGGTASTIIGMVGGAMGGHYAEKAVTANKNWVVTVQMDAGGTRTITTSSNPQVAIGDHVRVSENSLLPYKTHD